jgi:predicted nucleic acid-binding protein
VTVVVYDTGALIALERKDPAAHDFHERLVSRPGTHPPVVLVPVLAQAWRPQPGHWTPLSRVLTTCTVFAADSGVPDCGVCQSGHTTEEAKRAGACAARAALPAKKRPDAVDALVAMVAARHEQAVILTSDPDDLCAYRDALGPAGESVAVLPVASLAEFRLGKPTLL